MRILLGFAFAASVGLKLHFGLAQDAAIPPSLQVLAGLVEACLAVGLLATRSATWEYVALAFGFAALGAVGAMHVGLTTAKECGCLGSGLSLTWKAHLLLVGLLLGLSGGCIVRRRHA